jgi:two-component system OmpR family sensor kinase
MQKRSIYNEFSAKLIIATALFTIIMAFMFYGFTKATIYEGITQKLINKAQIVQKVSINSLNSTEKLKLIFENDISVDLVTIQNLDKLSLKQYQNNTNNHFIELLYPFDIDKHTFIKLTKNIDREDEMLKKIFSNLFILGLGGLIMVILYALAVSKTLLYPIVNISNKLSNMNEFELTKIDENKLPLEFIPLAKSINNLTNKIQTYVKYQKELFIGAAHELKTPLAVMKLKSEVTLIKKRPIEKYEDALKVTIKEINGMNSMIASILDMGRQEGAQFERAIDLDLVKFLKEKVANYLLLTTEKDITIRHICTIDKFIIVIQATLLNQIIQNFVQNALKFTKNGSTITIASFQKEDKVSIEVVDEGDGIDESIDLFAPFKRVGTQAGAGLGLYLAKSAADTIGASITLKNRTDGTNGAIATVTLNAHPTCELPKRNMAKNRINKNS